MGDKARRPWTNKRQPIRKDITAKGLVLPDPKDSTSTVPAIIKVSRVSNGRRQTFFRTIAVNPHYRHSWQSQFTFTDCESQAEAETLREQAIVKLEELQVAQQQEMVGVELATETRQLQARLAELMTLKDRLAASLAIELEAYFFSLPPEMATRLRIWLARGWKIVQIIERSPLKPIVVAASYEEIVQNTGAKTIETVLQEIDGQTAQLEEVKDFLEKRLTCLLEAKAIIDGKLFDF